MFSRGAVLQLNNFRRLTGFGWPGFTQLNLWRQDKGNAACVAAFIAALIAAEHRNYQSPMPFGELVEVTRAIFDVVEDMHAHL